MTTLDKEQIKRLHKKLLDATGGLDGLRDEGLLDSALSAAFQTFDGMELYPSATAKIARIAYDLVCNHLFVDGNKRIGTYVMMVLLELNRIEVGFSDDDIIHIGLELANGEMSNKQLLDLIIERSELAEPRQSSEDTED
jgi:death-on-curing protein